MNTLVKDYIVKVYAYLVKNGKREIDTLPEVYAVPVAEYIVEMEEAELND